MAKPIMAVIKVGWDEFILPIDNAVAMVKLFGTAEKKRDNTYGLGEDGGVDYGKTFITTEPATIKMELLDSEIVSETDFERLKEDKMAAERGQNGC